MLFPFLAYANAISPGSYYVTADSLNVRLAPYSKAKITNKLYRQQKLNVFEVKGKWARISKYYSGVKERVSGEVARWVSVKYLSNSFPKDKNQPNMANDPRINGIPKVGEYGATEKDVEILYTAARHFLESKKCKKIEYGDKSTSKPNTYYLNCGGAKNHFFKLSDIPRL
jgi:hypothetical protein